MRKLALTCIAITALTTIGFSQTLFKFGNDSVSKDEFLRIYLKNSMNKQADYSEKALREYLDLYSLFRMKVKEARRQEIDTTASIQYELNNYRKQLSKNYLTDEKMSEKLVQEAYGRMKEDVHVAHILLFNSQYSPSVDTGAVYARMDSIYNAIIKGKADFAAMAAKFSDDADSKVRGGDIGYITALQTVYPFENVAYNTPVGKISAPFRTQFGYHIIKVIDRRPSAGQVQVAQILAATPKSKGEAGIAAAKLKMDSVMKALKAGEKFDDVVKKYSDDKFTVNDGGVVAPFGAGDMTASYEKAAFALKNPGDLSPPVQTEYGFHLLKLIKKIPMKPYDSLRIGLKRKIENDSRAQMAKDAFVAKLKQQNGYKEYPANFDALVNKVKQIPDTGKNANAFAASDYKNMTQPLFTFAGKDYLQSDLMTYAETLTRGRLMGVKSVVLHDINVLYVKNVIDDYEEHRLVEENPEFKSLMDEYRDGIMLFELMDRNVWGKATKDTTGLKAFYETKKNKYQWEPGFKATIYIFKNEKALAEGQKLVTKKDIKDEEVLKKMNTEKEPDAVSVQHGRFEYLKYKEFPREQIVKGKTTEPKKNADGTYSVLKTEEVYETNMPKSLEEARGYIVAEYQDYLEKTWNEEMRGKYPMKVNEPLFKSLIK